MERSEIGFIKFIFEAYEGICVISTADSHRTVIAVRIAPGCEEEVELILKDLGKKIEIERVGINAPAEVN